MKIWFQWFKIALINFPYYNWTIYEGKLYTFSKWNKFIFFGKTWHCLYWEMPKGTFKKRHKL